jgi:hypothetical protein
VSERLSRKIHWEGLEARKRVACGRRRSKTLLAYWLAKPTCKSCLKAWKENR